MFISVPVTIKGYQFPYMMRLERFDKIYIQSNYEDDTCDIIGRDASGNDTVILKCESFENAKLSFERIENQLFNSGELFSVFEVKERDEIMLKRSPEEIPF